MLASQHQRSDRARVAVGGVVVLYPFDVISLISCSVADSDEVRIRLSQQQDALAAPWTPTIHMLGDFCEKLRQAVVVPGYTECKILSADSEESVLVRRGRLDEAKQGVTRERCSKETTST